MLSAPHVLTQVFLEYTRSLTSMQRLVFCHFNLYRKVLHIKLFSKILFFLTTLGCKCYI